MGLNSGMKNNSRLPHTSNVMHSLFRPKISSSRLPTSILRGWRCCGSHSRRAWRSRSRSGRINWPNSCRMSAAAPSTITLPAALPYHHHRSSSLPSRITYPSNQNQKKNHHHYLQVHHQHSPNLPSTASALTIPCTIYSPQFWIVPDWLFSL